MNAALQATLEFLKLYWAPLLCGVAVVAISAADRRLHRAGGTQNHGGHAGTAWAHARGTAWLLQPIADALMKLLIKEDIIRRTRTNSSSGSRRCFPLGRGCFRWLAWRSDRHFRSRRTLTLAFSSLWASARWDFGIVLGGWASNSHYSLMGALRSSAQLVSLRDRCGMALVSALLFTGTLNIKSIVEAQSKEGIWFVLLAPVAFFTYLVASIAETNRAPFDLPEAESELVRRVHDGVQRIPLVALFSGGIHEHDRGGFRGNDVVSGRLAPPLRKRARASRLSLNEFPGFVAHAPAGGCCRLLRRACAKAAHARANSCSCWP